MQSLERGRKKTGRALWQRNGRQRGDWIGLAFAPTSLQFALRNCTTIKDRARHSRERHAVSSRKAAGDGKCAEILAEFATRFKRKIEREREEGETRGRRRSRLEPWDWTSSKLDWQILVVISQANVANDWRKRMNVIILPASDLRDDINPVLVIITAAMLSYTVSLQSRIIKETRRRAGCLSLRIIGRDGELRI